MPITVKVASKELINRPRVSWEVLRYVMEIIYDEVLAPRKILKNNKYSYEFGLILGSQEDPNKETSYYPSFRISTTSGIKHATVGVFSHRLNSKTQPHEMAEFAIEALIRLFSVNFKKVSIEDADLLKKKLDLNKINSFKFPAPFEDQNYIGDNDPEVKRKYIEAIGC